jgi:hypothetical protein
MSERLIIRNFGPIREADIDVHDLTLFVGPQATGKSLATQILFFLRDIEYLLAGDVPRGDTARETVLSALQWWLGNDPSMYVQDKTVLNLVNGQTEYKVSWRGEKISVSQALSLRIEKAEQDRRKQSPKVYIPAGRSLYSFLPPHYTPSLRFVQNWPGYNKLFYETIGDLTELLWHRQESNQLSLFDGSSEFQFLRQRMTRVLKGKMRYIQNTVALEIGSRRFPSVALSAGQMETWPFWAVVEAGMVPLGLNFNPIYFEEPEAHLHPGAQVTIMEVVAHLVDKGTNFLITTHSPYILYAVNNFLLGRQVLKSQRRLPDSIPLESILGQSQVAAYRFSPDGEVHDIMDEETGLIDADELEQVAIDLGSSFSQLQESLGEQA